MKRCMLATLAAGVWINLCEFLRNELILKQQWLDKYQSLGQPFPSAAINGILWALWGFILAACIVAVSRGLSFVRTFLVIWTLAFLMMWIVAWNLSVLPIGLLPTAIPWSLAEVAVGILLARAIARQRKPEPPPPHTLPETTPTLPR